MCVVDPGFMSRNKKSQRYWLLIERGEAEICKTSPGLDENLRITAEAEAFLKWHACSPASRRSPAPPRAPHADMLDAATR